MPEAITRDPLMAALLAQVPAGVLLADRDGNLELMNDAARSLFAERPIEPLDWIIARVLLTGETVHEEEVMYLDAHEEWRTLSVSATPIEHMPGTIGQALLTSIDVTDRNRREPHRSPSPLPGHRPSPEPRDHVILSDHYPNRTAFALIALALLMAASSILGPFVLGIVRFHTSDGAIVQLIGGEVVSLLVVAPTAILAGILWFRDSPLAPPLALGAAGYALYMYVQYLVGPEYARYPGNSEYFFPLYLMIVVLAWPTAVSAWRRLTTITPPELEPEMQRVLGALMLLLNATFALAWISSIVAVLTGRPSREYGLDRTLFWVVRLMDLGFVIPASFIVGVGLLRLKAWATRLACGFLGFQTLIVAAVAGMAVMMTVRGDPSASALLIAVSSVLSAALSGMFLALLRRLAPLHRMPNDHTPNS